MGKRKTWEPINKPQKNEGNQKAIKLTIGAFIVLVLGLTALIVFTAN